MLCTIFRVVTIALTEGDAPAGLIIDTDLSILKRFI